MVNGAIVVIFSGGQHPVTGDHYAPAFTVGV